MSVDPGDGEEVVYSLWRWGQGLFLGELGAWFVGAEDVREVQRVRRRRDVREI
jgi:hypothetical protein